MEEAEKTIDVSQCYLSAVRDLSLIRRQLSGKAWKLRRRKAGELGFEPRLTESESVVLPLHHSPILRPSKNHKLAGPADKFNTDRNAYVRPLYAITVRRACSWVNTDGRPPLFHLAGTDFTIEVFAIPYSELHSSRFLLLECFGQRE